MSCVWICFISVFGDGEVFIGGDDDEYEFIYFLKIEKKYKIIYISR